MQPLWSLVRSDSVPEASDVAALQWTVQPLELLVCAGSVPEASDVAALQWEVQSPALLHSRSRAVLSAVLLMAPRLREIHPS